MSASGHKHLLSPQPDLPSPIAEQPEASGFPFPMGTKSAGTHAAPHTIVPIRSVRRKSSVTFDLDALRVVRRPSTAALSRASSMSQDEKKDDTVIPISPDAEAGSATVPPTQTPLDAPKEFPQPRAPTLPPPAHDAHLPSRRHSFFQSLRRLQHGVSANPDAVSPFDASNTVTPPPSTPSLPRRPSLAAKRDQPAFTIENSAAFRVMSEHIYGVASSRNWFSPQPTVVSGVALRQGKGDYVVSPLNHPGLAAFTTACAVLNPGAVIILSSQAVQTVTSALHPDASHVVFSHDLMVQVVDTMDQLAEVRAAQGACFIRTEGKFVVWCDDPAELVAEAEEWQAKVVAFVWTTGHSTPTAPSSRNNSTAGLTEAATTAVASTNASRASLSESSDGWTEKGLEIQYPPRPCRLNSAMNTGFSVGLNLIICGLYVRSLFKESLLDGNYQRMGLCAVLPFLFCVLLFLCDNVVSCIMQLFAPIGLMSENSLTYSGKPPIRLTENLPHMTVVMPVYKEGLRDVLAPTIQSIEKAIRTYELQGGSANILVCEDGLQLLPEDEAQERRDFYDRHNCAWVARHPKNRAGRFKKSSNMNVAKNLSLRVEELMDEREPNRLSYTSWSKAEDDALYKECLKDALAETNGLVWAEGNIRIGDYLLIIDSDTRVPEDCFLDGASEMEECPDVAILQHCSGTFLAGAGYFETGIAFFTLMVNFSISWTSLNLIKAGYTIRWASYTNGGFLEGVSLSCIDELNRWQKYAFGCSEMVFNPMREWHKKGPFSQLYWDFLQSPAPLAYKFTASSYVASYWAIAGGAPITIVIYFIQIFYWDTLDPAFSVPFRTWLTVIFIFTIGGTAGLIVGRYRSGQAALWEATWSQFKWLPFLASFFGGLSIHVFLGLAAHITGYDMKWAATVKDVTVTSVFQELPAIFRHFRYTFPIMFGFLGVVVLFASPAIPLEFQMYTFQTIFPACWMAVFHIIFPFVLNPTVMLFRF
ncbi:hypothetical protein MNV49_000499 [Pseudohyphozyma bogoriensis]|nr:hypothetical protein MNV49_000499 [Pseudohyphozyma bogoriensis]